MAEKAYEFNVTTPMTPKILGVPATMTIASPNIKEPQRMTRRIIISAAALIGGIALGALGTLLWVAEFI